MRAGRIASLHVYPVKGMRGVAVDAAAAEVTGLAAGGIGDREWMVVDAAGRFVTQREVPKLALIVPTLADDALTLHAPGVASLSVPLTGKPRAPAREVVVWRAHVRGHDEGDGVARWLRAFLGRDLRLVRFDRTKVRRCNPDYVGDSGAHTLFADGYPILVIGSASLADLNERLARKGERALPMDRFRPGVVVDGLDAYAEDHTDTLDCGGVMLRMVKPCTRCQVTTTDQATARVGREPLPTLATYRYDPRLAGVTFGMNAIVVQGAGSTLRVGSPAVATIRF
jgi:uncharacterized protein YcbX